MCPHVRERLSFGIPPILPGSLSSAPFGPRRPRSGPDRRARPGEIERAVAAFARSADGGLIVTGSALERHSDLIITLAARYKLPAVYNNPFPVTGGGLIS